MSFKGNGTMRQQRIKKDTVDKKKIADILGIEPNDVTPQLIVRCVMFTTAFDAIVRELFLEDWVVEYAKRGEARLVAIPFHGLSAAAVQTELYAAETQTIDGSVVDDPYGVAFNEGFAAAFSVMIRHFSTSSSGGETPSEGAES